MRSAELHEMVMEKDGGIEKGDKGYPGLYQLALSEYLKKMSDKERTAFNETKEEWQKTGPPMDVRLK
jgi:hypothetical protein